MKVLLLIIALNIAYSTFAQKHINPCLSYTAVLDSLFPHNNNQIKSKFYLSDSLRNIDFLWCKDIYYEAYKKTFSQTSFKKGHVDSGFISCDFSHYARIDSVDSIYPFLAFSKIFYTRKNRNAYFYLFTKNYYVTTIGYFICITKRIGDLWKVEKITFVHSR